MIVIEVLPIVKIEQSDHPKCSATHYQLIRHKSFHDRSKSFVLPPYDDLVVSVALAFRLQPSISMV